MQSHRQAYDWYDSVLTEDADRPDHYAYREEAVHHTLQSRNISGACKHAIPLGNHLWDLLLYRESLDLQTRVAAEIDSRAVEEAKKAQDENIPILLNNLGEARRNLGDAKQAIEFYKKALEILKNVYRSDHPSTRTVMANIEALKGQNG